MARKRVSVELREYVTSTALKVDTEKGRIEGVKVIGKISANGREYTEAALDKAIKDRIYENRPVNVNHPQRGSESRSAYDRFGKIVDPRRERDGIYGTLEYLKTHPLAAPLAEAAQRMPELFGLSHVASGKEERRAGKSIVEEIEHVISVDVVADPATTKGLFESQGHAMKKTAKQVYLEHFKADAKRVKLIEEELPADAAAVEMPAEGGSDVGSAFKAMICGVFDDESLDTQGKISKIKEILKAHEKLTAKEAPAETPADSPPAEEGRRSDMSAALREELAVRDLIEEAGLKFSKSEGRKAFIKSLIPLAEAERAALIEERKGQAEQPKVDNKPRSGDRKPLQEGKEVDFSDPKTFVRECFGAGV